MTESDMTRKLCRTLEAAGAKVIALVGFHMQENGLPDRLVVHEKFTGFVEAKRRDAVLTTAQKLQHSAIIARRFPCLIVRYYEEENTIWVETLNRDGGCGRLITEVINKKADGGHALLSLFREVWENKSSP